MKRLLAFLRAIHVRNTTDQWTIMNFHASINGAEIKPLEDILGVGLCESEFDNEVDKKFEMHAQQLLREKRMLKNG